MANDAGFSQTRIVNGHREMEYRPFPITQKFHDSKAYYRTILGPRGSGKSSACVNELVKLAMEQKKGPDGLRHTKWIIIRQTYGELMQTTLPTFLQWYPEGSYGKLRKGMPTTYDMEFDDVRAEFVFLAMSEAADVRKFMSMEATGAWVNECRLVDEAILDNLPGTVGRYPQVTMGGPTRACIIMDTNPPSEDHWLPRLEAKVEKAKADDSEREHFAAMPAGWDGLYPEDIPLGWSDEELEIPIEHEEYDFFHQPGGLTRLAENIPFLPGGYKYYIRLGAGKSPEFVMSMVHGKYTGVLGGTPVYPEFLEKNDINGQRVWWHVHPKPIELIKRKKILLGWDYGLTPSLVIAQLSPRGQLHILQEIEAKRMGLKQFVQNRVKPWLATTYAGFEFVSTGDPSGQAMSPTDEMTCHQILADAGIPTEPAYTNAFMTRRNAVGDFLNRTVDGAPAIVIDPRCHTLIEGFKRGYRYRKTKVEGEERETDKVDKNGNRFTHLQDALQYLCLRIARDENWSHIEETVRRSGGAARNAPIVP